MIVQAFYKGMTQPIRSTINAAVEETLMNKTEDEAYNLIEEMALNNFQWSNERGELNRSEVSLKLMQLLYLMLR